MLYFCTYFDSHYLIKGLALYRSLLRHAGAFRLWVLCFDDLTYQTLNELAFPEVVPIALGDFEKGDKELLQAKGNRSRIEYYFTATSSLLLYIFRVHPQVDVITYLDADLFFFADPSPIYRKLQNNSVLIIGHRFSPYLKHNEVYGIYNVGLLSFRRDDAALECLYWWRQRCLEWCYDRLEDGRFADQKYLDDWPTRFRRVVVLQHKGAGLAPWNFANYSLRIEGDQVFVDAQPLVFFHFHSLKQINNWLYDLNLAVYGAGDSLMLKRYIYNPYIRQLQEACRRISVSAHKRMGSIRSPDVSGAVENNYFRLLKKALKGDLWVVLGKE